MTSSEKRNRPQIVTKAELIMIIGESGDDTRTRTIPERVVTLFDTDSV